MTVLSEAVEFACHFRSCAPPPVGRGGSRGGPGSGNVSRARRAADVSRRGKALRGYISAKKAGDKDAMAKHVTEYRRARGVVADNRARGDATGRTPYTASKGKTRRTKSATLQRALHTSAARQQTRLNNRSGEDIAKSLFKI